MKNITYKRKSWNKGMKGTYSPEYLVKLRNSHFGKKFSEKRKRNMSLSQIGHIVTEETREKIRNAQKGKVISKEQIEKMKKSLHGRKVWNKGLTKEDPRVAKYGFNSGKSRKGKPLAEKAKIKISEANRGEKSYLWKGGISKIKKILRNNVYYTKWRKEVFEKDNYTCQKCAKKGRLNAHHITPFPDILLENNIKDLNSAIACSQLWDTNNGITLCLECHKKTDNFLKNNRNLK